MALDKFMDLVLNSRLFFANAASMTDKYEATIPRRNVKAYRDRLEAKGTTGRELEEAVDIFTFETDSLRDLTLINTWSIGREESYALWKIYLGGSRAGVAIRTSVSRLTKALEAGHDPHPEDVHVGRVRYTDKIAQEDISRHYVVTTKNRYYEYEQELRLYILYYPRSEAVSIPPFSIEQGRYVRVDVELLAEQIYLSPFAAPWVHETTRRFVSHIRPSLSHRIRSSAVRDR